VIVESLENSYLMTKQSEEFEEDQEDVCTQLDPRRLKTQYNTQFSSRNCAMETIEKNKTQRALKQPEKYLFDESCIITSSFFLLAQDLSHIRSEEEEKDSGFLQEMEQNF